MCREYLSKNVQRQLDYSNVSGFVSMFDIKIPADHRNRKYFTGGGLALVIFSLLADFFDSFSIFP